MFSTFLNTKRFVYITFLLLTIIIRVPFSNISFTGDFATHLIISEWILNGNLPYIEYKDFKPPILYLFSTIISFLSNKSFLLINFYCSIVIALNTYLIFTLSNNFTNLKNSFFGSLIYIFYTAYLASSGEQFPNPHLSNLFVLLSFIFLLKDKGENKYFWIGVFLGMACMIRQNLIFIPFFVGIYIFLNSTNYPKFRSSLKNIFLFICGGVLVYIILLIPYFLNGYTETFIKETILNPLTFQGDHLTTRLDLTAQLIRNILHIYNYDPNWLKFFNSVSFWLLITIIFIKFIFEQIIKKRNNIFNFKFVSIVTYILAISLSIIITFKPLSHYIIQVLPFLIIFFLYCIGQKKFSQIIKINLFIFFTLSSINMFYSYIDYIKSNKSISNTSTYIVAEYLQNNLSKNDKIYIFQPSIVYWIIDKFPIQESAHYSDIFKDSILKSRYGNHHNRIFEFESIVRENPKYLVFSANFDFEEFLVHVYLYNNKDTNYAKSKIDYYLNNYSLVFATKNKKRFNFYSYGSGTFNNNYLIYKKN
jgi:hypothetical protein